MLIVIFGVSGVGKTTIGKLLAHALGWKFIEGDDFHPAANIEKMKCGEALNDDDRQPWLASLREQIEQSIAANEHAVLACSALKKEYRDQLRVKADVRFVYLRGSRDRIGEQLKQRRGHFFDPKLLDSQFADLEEPDAGEDSLIVDIVGAPEKIVDRIKSSLRAGAP
jgi:gluconokinase